MQKPTIKQVLDLLENKYGKRKFAPHHDPLSELILTILSQNTSDLNSRAAFAALKSHFKNWEDLLKADPANIAEIIKSGGLGQIKAGRIQQALQGIQERQGSLDLSLLETMPVSQAREWLKSFPGVGNKTANCVLLFALGRPALPVDTHIFRVSKRLGLIPEKASLDDAHRILEKSVKPGDIYTFHLLMIEHGRQTCIAQRPRCPVCILKEICPSFAKFTGTRK